MSTSSEKFKPSGATPKSRLSDLFHEQPLIIAALGVAVGAAFGAALPITKVEDEWLGGVSSSVKQAAKEAAQGEIDELKSAAGRATDHIRQTAGDTGLSGDNPSDFARDLGEDARSAMRDAASTPYRRV